MKKWYKRKAGMTGMRIACIQDLNYDEMDKYIKQHLTNKTDYVRI